MTLIDYIKINARYAVGRSAMAVKEFFHIPNSETANPLEEILTYESGVEKYKKKVNALKEARFIALKENSYDSYKKNLEQKLNEINK